MDSEESLREVEMFDPITKQCTIIEPMPKGMANMASAYHDNIVYVCGGQSVKDGYNSEEIMSLDTTAYDNLWQRKQYLELAIDSAFNIAEVMKFPHHFFRTCYVDDEWDADDERESVHEEDN